MPPSSLPPALPPTPLFRLLDRLCRTPSWWMDGEDCPGEAAAAALVAEHLRASPWLRVSVEEAAPGRPNVWATDCDDADVELLLVGHLDTVPPTPGWTVAEHAVEGGRYHALGAADAKGGIAAVLDAVAAAGPTRGVGILLYADEETTFQGMHAFLRDHPQVRPAHTLSACGPPAQMLAGCRGIIEVELLLSGFPGHASRPWTGTSAGSALQAVTAHLHRAVPDAPTPLASVLNVAAAVVGSRSGAPEPQRGPPPVRRTANRIPDVAWALLEVRAGGPPLDADWLRGQVHEALFAFNDRRPHPAVLERFDVHFALDGYASDTAAIAPFARCFSPLHAGHHADPVRSGYIDVAMLASDRQVGAVCMGPESGGAHAPDEWVDLDSLVAYRQGVVALLGEYAAG